ncbi:hypothetical protein GCM10011506_14960 [Marivirga lumbricoides]|uniref:Secretion system C-terminal sorting domain-containing protein n=1 Tax=Marivirga lumbricoides TaxID=1046115 RepID=A0ABQ1LVA6_9BACT|nr:hypothetical protein GCM10011506_14960 [Marivirga lumbricoides]
MSLSRIFLGIILIAFNSSSLIAQKEVSNWIVGESIGFNFNNGRFDIFNRPTNPDQTLRSSTISYSDPTTGELLFFSDGKYLWNRDFGIVNRDNPFKSGVNSLNQTIISTPIGNNEHIIFTIKQSLDQNDGAFYHIYNTEKNELTSINEKVVSGVAEKITLIPKNKKYSYWLIMQDLLTSNLLIYSVEGKSIDLINSYPLEGLIEQPELNDNAGYLQSSPNGEFLVNLNYSENPLYNIVELFRFNKVLGEIVKIGTLGNYDFLFSAIFSPDNSKLFITYGGDGSGTEPLIQYDLSVASVDEIIRTRDSLKFEYEVFPESDLFHTITPTILQTGYDGKIYNSFLGSIRGPNGALNRTIAIIKNPNEKIQNIDFEIIALKTEAIKTNIGFVESFPQFPQYYFDNIPTKNLYYGECPGLKSLVFYPNPTDDVLYLSYDNPVCLYPFEIEVFNSFGQLITKFRYNKEDEGVSLSNFSSGLYFILVRNNYDTILRKVVVL